MLQNTKAKTFGYGVKNLTDYKVKILEKSFSGLKTQYQRHRSLVKVYWRF